MARSKITVNTSPVANRHVYPDEKIIEFDSPNGGGLICFRMRDDGTLVIEPYRLDGTVDVELEPDAYRFYTLRPSDVGKTTLAAFGRTWLVVNFMGHIGPHDVGKRVYCVADPGSQTGPGASPVPRYLLQVENDEQRDRRTGGETA